MLPEASQILPVKPTRIFSLDKALETAPRFGEPGFRPNPQYVREMKHYGVLPADQPDAAALDPYQVDRRYWQSLWYRPETALAK